MSELSNDLRAKVLIAEDDAIVALDLQGMVSRLGYDVVAIADSGPNAIASAKRFQPDIILLDMVLNGSMDGIDVAREIQRDIDVPIVFCVSSPDLSALVRAKEITYAGYLLKPINPDSLATTLDTALYKYKLEKRVRKAEERYKSLADKCEMISYFIEGHAAFEWSYANGSPRIPEGSAIHSSFTEGSLAPSLAKAAEACLSSEGRKIATFATVSDASGKDVHAALICLYEGESDAVKGLVIPLTDQP